MTAPLFLAFAPARFRAKAAGSRFAGSTIASVKGAYDASTSTGPVLSVSPEGVLLWAADDATDPLDLASVLGETGASSRGVSFTDGPIWTFSGAQARQDEGEDPAVGGRTSAESGESRRMGSGTVRRDSDRGSRMDRLTLIEVTLLAPGTPPTPGQILELGDEGAVVRFPQPGAPVVAIAQRVLLRLASRRSSHKIEVPAAARLSREEERSRLVDFEFAASAKASRPVRLSILSLLERRVRFRVLPALTSSIEVALLAGRKVLRRGTVADVSETGIGAWVRGRGEGPLAGVFDIRMTFRLPSSREGNDLLGWIRTRAASGAGIRYGIEFDPERSPDFERQSEGIRRYMTERQREILRMGVLTDA